MKNALALAFLLAAAAPHQIPPTPAEVLAASADADWQIIDPADLVFMDLANGKRVTFMLAPEIAPAHVANIRALIRARWFDDGAVYRVDDNYVVQWGQGESGKATPTGLGEPLPAEYELVASGFATTRFPYRDAYASNVGYRGALPIATEKGRSWAVHCHGVIAAARDLKDSGNGGELYAVIGESPRWLDRNFAIVGRMVDGFDHIATLPRGTGDLGMYEKAEQRTAITRVTLAADVAENDRPAYEWLRPESKSYDRWLYARANRQNEFFTQPAGAVDLCRGLPPIRPAKR